MHLSNTTQALATHCISKHEIKILNEVIPLCYLNIYFITICFRQHN